MNCNFIYWQKKNVFLCECVFYWTCVMHTNLLRIYAINFLVCQGHPRPQLWNAIETIRVAKLEDQKCSGTASIYGNLCILDANFFYRLVQNWTHGEKDIRSLLRTTHYHVKFTSLKLTVPEYNPSQSINGFV